MSSLTGYALRSAESLGTLTSSWTVDARAYWDSYLWHHRHPGTRRLHRIGSWTCIAGAAATAAGLGWGWLPASIAVGYGFAFAGHWLVEQNRPLTLRHPVRAAVCNWLLFGYESFWDVEVELRRLARNPPSTDLVDSP